jgi:hypothetical protein
VEQHRLGTRRSREQIRVELERRLGPGLEALILARFPAVSARPAAAVRRHRGGDIDLAGLAVEGAPVHQHLAAVDAEDERVEVARRRVHLRRHLTAMRLVDRGPLRGDAGGRR